MIFVLHFDGPYMKWTEIYIRSMLKVDPSLKVYISGINLNKTMVNQLRNFPNVIEVTNKKVVPDKKLIRETGKGVGWMTQIISMRAASFLEVIKKYPKEDFYVTTDVDMLMVQSMDSLKKNMRKKDIGLCVFEEHNRRGESLKKDKILAGIVCARNTKPAMEYLEKWKLYSTGKHAKTIDQRALLKSYKEMKGQMRVYPIPRSYLDPEFEVKSFIWSAHKSKTGTKDVKYSLFKHFIENADTSNINPMKTVISKHRKQVAEVYIQRLRIKKLQKDLADAKLLLNKLQRRLPKSVKKIA